MPDAFFATQKPRKRKQPEGAKADGPTSSRPSKLARTSKKPLRSSTASKAGPSIPNAGKSRRQRALDEELESDGSDGAGDDTGIGAIDNMDLRASDSDPGASGEEDEDETPAEKRLRLAKLYLESVKEDLADGEFDAAEIDKELISARLKQDVLEHTGKVHIHIADSVDFSTPPSSVFYARSHRFSVTAAVASEDGQSLYTSGKEGTIVRWDLKTGKKVATFHKVRPDPPSKAQTSKKGKGKAYVNPGDAHGHTDEVWALALSGDGRYLASGSKDRRIGIWDTTKNEWVKGFGGHKDFVSSLAFRKGTQQLYSGSFDRTIKVFDLGVMGYVETLFGHQDAVQAIDALRAESVVSVGGRDRTARFWKIVEETQLVFRGGGRSKVRELLEGGALQGMDEDEEEANPKADRQRKGYIEGSLECIAMIDEMTFVTGGDSGSISLWSTQKKKPVFTHPVAHGFNEVHSETEGLIQTPRYVTALGALRYSDMFASGSWEGDVRIWKVETPKLRSFTLVGTVSLPGVINSLQLLSLPKGVLDNASWVRSPQPLMNGIGQSHDRPKSKNPVHGVLLVAGVGQEPKFGRWVTLKEKARNQAAVFALYPS